MRNNIHSRKILATAFAAIHFLFTFSNSTQADEQPSSPSLESFKDDLISLSVNPWGTLVFKESSQSKIEVRWWDCGSHLLSMAQLLQAIDSTDSKCHWIEVIPRHFDIENLRQYKADKMEGNIRLLVDLSSGKDEDRIIPYKWSVRPGRISGTDDDVREEWATYQVETHGIFAPTHFHMQPKPIHHGGFLVWKNEQAEFPGSIRFAMSAPANWKQYALDYFTARKAIQLDAPNESLLALLENGKKGGWQQARIMAILGERELTDEQTKKVVFASFTHQDPWAESLGLFHWFIARTSRSKNQEKWAMELDGMLDNALAADPKVSSDCFSIVMAYVASGLYYTGEPLLPYIGKSEPANMRFFQDRIHHALQKIDQKQPSLSEWGRYLQAQKLDAMFTVYTKSRDKK